MATPARITAAALASATLMGVGLLTGCGSGSDSGSGASSTPAASTLAAKTAPAGTRANSDPAQTGKVSCPTAQAIATAQKQGASAYAALKRQYPSCRFR